MRACFLGQNITKLGYGVAILHTPRLPDPPSPQPEDQPAPADNPPPAGENSSARRAPEPA